MPQYSQERPIRSSRQAKCRRGLQPASPDDEHGVYLEAALSIQPDLRDKQVRGIAQDFGARKLGKSGERKSCLLEPISNDAAQETKNSSKDKANEIGSHVDCPGSFILEDGFLLPADHGRSRSDNE